MTRREGIILSAMGLVIVYGAYTVLSPSSSSVRNPSTDPGAVAAFVSQAKGLVDELRKISLSAAEKHVFERAQTAWTEDPFLGVELSPVRAPGQAARKEQVQFAYTGFVDAGAKRLAVINGLEYEVGDVLEPTAYELRSIAPEEVLLEHGEKKSRITIPFTGGIFR